MTSIATWNVNSIRARIEHLTTWLKDAAPDVVGIQETKVQDADFPLAELEALGYHTLYSGQKSYNGVALLSKEPATLIATELPGFDDPQRRVLAAKVAGITLLNLYVPNGSEVGSEKYAYKLAWLDALGDWVARLAADGEPLMLVGDFNIAPDDRDVHDPDAWRGKILCSDDERERLNRLLGLGLTDVFRQFEQAPGSFSWWDYRGGGFRRNEGLRIDLILASATLAERCAACAVDLAPRRWEKPSDHAPVVARLRP
ncbi:MAG: exodeoxyribonuclease III [Gammaproteobacteria bacterium]|nr:exodeoxyribonuclease III [Gammaproteobacteria bacterium]